MIGRLLEAMSDLSPRFELLIVDDASRDATLEVAHAAEVRFPQVRVIGLPRRLGYKAALQYGLARAKGNVVLYSDTPHHIPDDQLQRAWDLSADVDAVFARRKVGRENPSFGLAAPTGWFSASRTRRTGGFQMVRRGVLEKLRWLPIERVELMVALSERGYDWVELEHPARENRPLIARRETPSGRMAKTPSQRPKRPNYLDRLKRFALGE